MRSSLCLIVCAVALSACAGPRVAPISATRYQQDIDWLAADARAGRGTGSPGLAAAAEFVAARFEAAGLTPAGDDGGWFQHFEVPGLRVLSEGPAFLRAGQPGPGWGNTLVVAGNELELGADWMPFASVPACDVSGPLMFAGYGISDAEGQGYDDYASIDVKGKIVLVLRGGPGGPESHYNGGPGQEQVQFAAKINAAYTHGAAGILIVNDPAGHPPGSGQDITLPYNSPASEGLTSSLPAAQLTAAAAERALADVGLDLAGMQQLIERTGQPVLVELGDSAPMELIVSSEREPLPTMNVVGVLPGNDPERADEWILVGAHMDHLGLGQRGSMGDAGAQGEIHNGADDNASGTAGVIEIADALGRLRGGLPRTVVFVAFGAEELGLLGSVWLNEHPPWPDGGLVTMVNMDMIGRAQDGQVELGGLGTADVYAELLDDVVAGLGGWAAVVGEAGAGDKPNTDQARLLLSTTSGVTSNSDHYTFVKSDVPVLTLFTGLHDDYHKPSDDSELIDAESGALIATLAGEFVVAVSELDRRPVFHDVEAERPAQVATVRPPEGRTVMRGGVRFGSRPDYSYAGDDGVHIDGVGADSPAELCGLTQGDLIVAIDGTPIRNIQDYMVLLYSHRPGDEMVLDVLRDGEQVVLTAVLTAGKNAGR